MPRQALTLRELAQQVITAYRYDRPTTLLNAIKLLERGLAEPPPPDRLERWAEDVAGDVLHATCNYDRQDVVRAAAIIRQRVAELLSDGYNPDSTSPRPR
jgi:hypothetical protein